MSWKAFHNKYFYDLSVLCQQEYHLKTYTLTVKSSSLSERGFYKANMKEVKCHISIKIKRKMFLCCPIMRGGEGKQKRGTGKSRY